MGRILTPALLAQRHAEAEAVSGVAGHMPQHNDDDGECFADLDGMRVLVKYEMTSIGVEVTLVCINGHHIAPSFFAADTLRDWQRGIYASRTAAGYSL